MSSDLKDARWQLASEMAGDDGMDFYAMDYVVKSSYLGHAQAHIDSYGDTDMISRLAAKFRKEDDK